MKFRHGLGLAGVAAAIASIPVLCLYGWQFALMCAGTACLCLSFASLMVPDEEGQRPDTAYPTDGSSPDTLVAKKHYSDCSVYNMPAFPAGPCDCGGMPDAT